MPRERSYYDTPRKESGKKKDRRRFSILDFVMLGISAVIAVAVILSWAARWINPGTYGFMSAMGLLMPVLFIANFMCLLYWVIRWRWGVFVPLAVFIVGVWGITMFWRPQLTQSHTDNSRDRSLVNIMTYNVRGMIREVDHKARTFVSSMDSIISVVDSLKPGILCMQEFQSTHNYSRRHFEDALPQYHYKRVRYNIGGDDDLGWGLAIYSKHPIARSGHIDFKGTSNSVIWADIAVNRDTIRVFNAHLQTTSITATDQEYIVNMGFVGDSTRTAKMKRMVGRMRDNYIIRAGQADTLAADIKASPYPVIVCGDFNDTSMSYAYRKINKRLHDSFREAGHGYGYTYRGFFNMLRIDYVFHSKSMECVEYASPSFDCSDHNPVTVKMRLNNNTL